MLPQINFKSPKIQSLIIALVFFFIVFLPIWWITNAWYADKLVQDQKIQDRVELELIKNSISHSVSRRSALFEGLCAFVESDPREKHLKAEVNILMRGLYSHTEGIRVMALAPGGIQKYVYPLKGNETVLGHDILHDKRPHIQKAMNRALKTKKIIFNGPYKLRQGGMALVLRKAIFIENKLWGLAAMVIDVPPILQESGYLIKANMMQLGLKDNHGEVFYGDKDIFKKDPLVQKISFLDGHWELAGIPIGGWDSFVAKRRGLFKIGSLLIALLLSIIIFLIYYRQKGLDLKVQLKTKELSNQIEAVLNSERSLRESEERFRKMIEKSPLPMVITDENQDITSFNDKFTELFGYTIKDVSTAEKWWKLAYPDETYREKVLQSWTDAIEHAKKNNEDIAMQMWELTIKDKTKRMCEFYMVPLGDVGLIIIKDITEKEKLETQLQQAKKMESIGILAGGIAHDFNNILYPIIGFTEMSMQDLPITHQVQENLQDVLDGAKRARDLVKQILKFSRQEKQVLKPTLLKPVVEEAMKLLRSTIPANIDIQGNLYDGKDYVLCDDTEIHEIVMNLFTNAYHSMEENGGTIMIELNKQNPSPDMMLPSGEYICLSVRDNGAGIPKDIIDNIFEPYLTTKELGKGSGLGLSVVHGIVISYKGDISVESSPGKGSIFNIFLPVTTQSMQIEQKLEKGKPLAGNENILFVDDEASIVKLSTRILERLGYTITGKTNSTEALELFKEKPDKFDLVITDMAMPNMTGAEFAKKILKIQPGIPIIMCTGFSENVDPETAKSMGIKGYIKKPILTDELTSKIRDVFDRSSKG